MDCNFESTLPPELWIIIFQMLSRDDLVTLRLVSKRFHQLSRPFFWEWLILCSLKQSSEAKARIVLRNPELGAQVKHLELRPSSWGFVGSPTWHPTNLWEILPHFSNFQEECRDGSQDYPPPT
ncbi:hypothetical protein BDN72DRAFT_894315 [Pluteus cervinus]|uniref:Uncharacterized protein n=1 Tax=Pluteus cervinus TaxID=181527 RepID=A0ACD3B5J8_9AGAR|nr:hypothetical protein BDN72DRAFT_894315 [Pluteus cervinus]